MKLEDLVCWNKYIASEQEKNSRKFLLGVSVVDGYARRGCYECDGLNFECEYYVKSVTVEKAKYGRK